jgi:hypothetical protein
MSAITQLPIPIEVQELVRQFTYYSKIEYQQRKHHKRLMSQFQVCERIDWGMKHLYYDYFYYKMENFLYRCEKKQHFFLVEITFMSAIFCKQCHEYVSSYSHLPENIICDCLPDLIEGPVAVD